jgi:hypothetical protein
MTPQAVLFGMLVSTLIGALFHLWRGGGLGRMLLYILLSWFGFWGGHFLAAYLGWNFAAIGALNLGTGILMALLVIAIGYWLSLVKIEKQ